jgi:hypothetical protein
MKVEPKNQKVLVISEDRNVGQIIDKAVAEGHVDVVIWIRGLHRAADEPQAPVREEKPVVRSLRNGVLPKISLWRQTMGY